MDGRAVTLTLMLLTAAVCQDSPAIDILNIIEKASCPSPSAKLTEVFGNVFLCARRCGMSPWCLAMDFNITDRRCKMFDQTCCSLTDASDNYHSNIANWPEEIQFPCGQGTCSKSQTCIPKSHGESFCTGPMGESYNTNLTSVELDHSCNDDGDCTLGNSFCDVDGQCACQCGYTYNPSIGACISGMRDCSFWKETLQNPTSGVYTLDISTCDVANRYPSTYCDMETDGGGWTLIQRRNSGCLDFYRTWAEYKSGFGNPASEFWLGNDNIHAMTSNYNFEIRFDLWSFDDEYRFAVYTDFVLGSEEDKYQLNCGNYSGDAGDALYYSNGQKFSTYNEDNDKTDRNCAEEKHGAWWYKSCAYSNLNGFYSTTGNTATVRMGVNWTPMVGRSGSLARTEIKIRRSV